MDSKFLKEAEVALMLQVPLYTLVRLRKEGNGPSYVKIGVKIRYIEADIIKWLKKENGND